MIQSVETDGSFGWIGYRPLNGLVTGELHAGVVRQWFDDAGWGVIDSVAAPGGCWMHFSAIVSGGYRRLDTGAPVTLTVEQAGQDGYSYRAAQVWPRGVDVGSLPMAVHDPSGAYRSTLTITVDNEQVNPEPLLEEQRRRLARERLMIIDAVAKAVDRRGEVLVVISEAEDHADARDKIVGLLEVTETGATAIMDLQLRRFSRQSAQHLRNERDDLLALLKD